MLLFDGAMGTMLQQAGLPAGACPEILNIERPTVITDIHRQYIAAGADIIETNTFGANPLKLADYDLAEKAAAINQQAVKAALLAKDAGGNRIKIAGAVGPTGKFIYPLGDLDFEAAYQAYLTQITALAAAGVDMIIIETIIDIQEMRAALLAAKQATSLPVICQLSFSADGRTITGTNPETAAATLSALGASVIGANCSLGPAQLLPIVTALTAACSRPVSVQPNAGLPALVNGQTTYPMKPAEFGDWAQKLAAAGADYLGGCCGTTPDHIRAAKQATAGLPKPARPKLNNPPGLLILSSRSKTVTIGAGRPLTIIGERINPTGRKALAADLKNNSLAAVKKEALDQITASAQILDVNMGVPGLDEVRTMRRAIEQLAMLVDAPLAIDTGNPQALEAGLRAYPGRALINSVSGEPDRLKYFLPLAKKYGAAVLCLPVSPQGIPARAEDRLTIIKEIIAAGLTAGLTTDDFLLDALVLTVAAEPAAAAETLRTLRLYRENLGYPATMGLSNVSYGLPNRPAINATFCAMAIAAGLDAPILNPYDPLMRGTIAAAAVITGQDPSGINYCKQQVTSSSTNIASPPATPDNLLAEIRQAVVNGEKEAVVTLVTQALTAGFPALTITDQALTAALNEVGQAFGAGKCFLPQVLLAAETMRAAFDTIKKQLPGQTTLLTKETIVLATVKGDIHDLGKNIVAALLENSGYQIIDLGKDVPPETIVAATSRHQAAIVGLCSLMTTTLPQIDVTIKKLKDAGATAKIMVGGAVLTPEYASTAGADAYARDGVEAVKIAADFLKS